MATWLYAPHANDIHCTSIVYSYSPYRLGLHTRRRVNSNSTYRLSELAYVYGGFDKLRIETVL